MSLTLVYSRALGGMNASLVEVEVHLANGLPRFNIVGLPNTEVKESRDRVRAAIIQNGFDLPVEKITVNLIPVDLPRESSRLDLPIALDILAALGQINPEKFAQYELAGELALSGLLRPVRGALAMVWQGMQAGHSFVLPQENTEQTAVIHGIAICGARSLDEMATYLDDIEPLIQAECKLPQRPPEQNRIPDLADTKGQHTTRLVLEIAAASGHNLLTMGPPGAGKPTFSQRLPGILPPLTEDELVEVQALRSLLPDHQQQLDSNRPFRSPHHSANSAAMVGGGSDPRSGEISLAHHGVLFLDELPEFDRKVLKVLREPLGNGKVYISRAAHQAVYPAKFQPVAAMNPCPCGYLGHPSKPCRCTPENIARYRNKISGPLLDRIDSTIEVPSLSAAELIRQEAGESDAAVLRHITAAHKIQYGRQGKVNAELSVSKLDGKVRIQKEAQGTLETMLEKLSLSVRSFHCIIRVAHTLANLAGDEGVSKTHVMKTIGFRRAL